MLDTSVNDLFDFYAPEDKQNFFVAYLYLKHMDHFAYSVLQTLGMPTAEPTNHPGPSVDAMLRSYVKQIAMLAPSRDTNIYHGKVIKHEDARKLVSLDVPISRRVPERVVPFAIARDVILETPGAMAVGICACRQNQPKPCVAESEMEACLIMGDPFASFIAANNPRFRKCTKDEALAVLEKAHARGDVHTAYFKKEFGNRLMAICNCCSCCCMGMVMWNKLKGAVPFLAPSGYTAEISDDCTGCGSCADRCPFNALTMDETTGKAVVDYALCMGCGVCQDSCPAGGARLRKDSAKGEPLDIDMLSGT